MSALPSDPAEADTSVPSQDETHQRLHELLSAVTDAVLEAQPQLASFHAHRPERDRSSGDSWRGLQTLCHVSALLVTTGRPERSAEATGRVIEAVHRAAATWGMRPRAEQVGAAMTTLSWAGPAGDLLELVLGVRVAVRAVSAPFLPGSLAPIPTTSPVSALSPLTPPPRRVR